MEWFFSCIHFIHGSQVGKDMLVSGFLQPISDVAPIIPSRDETLAADPTVAPYEPNIISFYNTWDHYGALSNFSPHAIHIADDNGDYGTWMTVEHYYQVLNLARTISTFDMENCA